MQLLAYPMMLPVTGLPIGWFGVAGVTLVLAGLALLRMFPRRRG